jgi:hypothetical protein
MPDLFWHLAGVVWFMGHMQFNVRGVSVLTTDETWELSRFWTRKKIFKKRWKKYLKLSAEQLDVE